jgi:cytoskeleton protein RodZ
MNFEELGQVFKDEREKRGLTVAVVMEATKISRTSIEALEAGNRSALPHPVYAKGFFRSYARYLGLDADELCMVVDREFQDEESGPREYGYDVAPNAEKAFQGAEKTSEGKRRSSLVLIVALVLLIGVVVLLIFSFKGGDKVSSSDPRESAQVEKSAMDAAPSASQSGSQAAQTSEEGGTDLAGSAPAEADEQAQPGEESSTSAPQAVDEGAAADETAAAGTPDQPAPALPAAKPEKPAASNPAPAKPVAVPREQEESITASDVDAGKQKYEHVVIIRATTEKGCWIGLWKGDEVNMARDFVLKEGEPLRLMFNSPRRIRIGNASGVSVSYNGKPYPLDAARGNIQTLRFGE